MIDSENSNFVIINEKTSEINNYFIEKKKF